MPYKYYCFNTVRVLYSTTHTTYHLPFYNKKITMKAFLLVIVLAIACTAMDMEDIADSVPEVRVGWVRLGCS